MRRPWLRVVVKLAVELQQLRQSREGIGAERSEDLECDRPNRRLRVAADEAQEWRDGRGAGLEQRLSRALPVVLVRQAVDLPGEGHEVLSRRRAHESSAHEQAAETRATRAGASDSLP